MDRRIVCPWERGVFAWRNCYWVTSHG